MASFLVARRTARSACKIHGARRQILEPAVGFEADLLAT
jgi:hypothetical protein